MVDVTGVKQLVSSNVGLIEAGAAGLVVGSALGGVAGYAIGSKKKSKRKSSRKNTRKRSSVRKGRRKYKYARTAGKRKDRSTKRIRMTKNGQPYVILSSGKARFISKRSARLSRKRKGGRY